MPDSTLPAARDWMTSDVVSFSPDQPLFEAIDKLLANSFAAAPVVDTKRRVLGMLTEKDCLRALAASVYDGHRNGRVADYQSPLLGLCEPDMDLFRISELFLSNNFPLLPVVDTEARLCGVISRRDMLRGIGAFRQDLIRKQGVIEAASGHQTDRPRSIEGLQRAAASQSREQLASLLRHQGES